ncbi:MAG TPA: hypothetical protein DEO43_06500 [Halieaceae bacterium]|jgi:hypothetical protein|nr:hypothetical protein [Halieaceae bacterium]
MEFWLYLHILLLVFWVGTDLGVFLAAKYSERSEFSMESRQVVLMLGMMLDRLPRSALVLIVPSGLMLTQASGLTELSPSSVLGIWVFAACWLALLWAGFLSESTRIQSLLAAINWWLNLILALVLLIVVVYSYVHQLLPSWILTKILLVALICVAGFLLDLLFGPAMGIFAHLADMPSDVALNHQYRQALRPVYWVVLLIYVLALGAAAVGVFKWPA